MMWPESRQVIRKVAARIGELATQGAVAVVPVYFASSHPVHVLKREPVMRWMWRCGKVCSCILAPQLRAELAARAKVSCGKVASESREQRAEDGEERSLREKRAEFGCFDSARCTKCGPVGWVGSSRCYLIFLSLSVTQSVFQLQPTAVIGFTGPSSQCALKSASFANSL